MSAKLPKTTPELSNFPPNLRKIALVFAESPNRVTLKKACAIAKVNYDVAKAMIYKRKQKGKNFWDLVNQLYFECLRDNIYRVDQTLVQKAVEGSLPHMQMFYNRAGIKLTPDAIKEDEKVHLRASVQLVPPGSAPQPIAMQKEKQALSSPLVPVVVEPVDVSSPGSSSDSESSLSPDQSKDEREPGAG